MKIVTVKVLMNDDEYNDIILDECKHCVVSMRTLEEDIILEEELDVLAEEFYGYSREMVLARLSTMYYDKSMDIIEKATQYILDWEED